MFPCEKKSLFAICNANPPVDLSSSMEEARSLGFSEEPFSNKTAFGVVVVVVAIMMSPLLLPCPFLGAAVKSPPVSEVGMVLQLPRRPSPFFSLSVK
jgi:hypothetical protein